MNRYREIRKKLKERENEQPFFQCKMCGNIYQLGTYNLLCDECTKKEKSHKDG